MSEKTAIGYARELVASLWHSFPEDAEQPIAAAIAAAEERGRRAGIEERDGLRAALRDHVQYLRGLRDEIDGEICPDGAHIEWCSDLTRAIERIDAALAPRDSGKEPLPDDADAWGRPRQPATQLVSGDFGDEPFGFDKDRK